MLSGPAPPPPLWARRARRGGCEGSSASYWAPKPTISRSS